MLRLFGGGNIQRDQLGFDRERDVFFKTGQVWRTLWGLLKGANNSLCFKKKKKKKKK